MSCYIPCFSTMIHDLNCCRTEAKKFCSNEKAANYSYQIKYMLEKPTLVLFKCNLSKYDTLPLSNLILQIHIISI